MKMILLSIAALILWLPAEAQAAAVKYEPDVVTLSGMLDLEEIKEQGLPVTIFYLKLDRPVDIEFDPKNEANRGETGIMKIQLNIKGDEIISLVKANRDMPAQAIGTLRHARTSREHTPVVMTVDRLQVQ
ncbi:MAG: hypothetical protein WDO70_10780 [Alphaproteobacteria bacterium]